MGIPIVSTRVTGIVDPISDGVTGLLVPPREALPFAAAILKLAGDSDLRQRFSRAAVEHVRTKFSETRVNRLWMAEYQRLALQSAPDGAPARVPAGTRI